MADSHTFPSGWDIFTERQKQRLWNNQEEIVRLCNGEVAGNPVPHILNRGFPWSHIFEIPIGRLQNYCGNE